jgi:hypothetical protein
MDEITARNKKRAAEISPLRDPAHDTQPPGAVKVVLPVWGTRFIAQFLEFCLPSLLAQGNIPALADALPTEFVLLTSSQDENVIKQHAAWRSLKEICRTELLFIDDLITHGNHTTTLTLAYTRAIRLTGDAMLDTCFFLLVSDYVLADGSLGRVLKRVQNGASGVLTGNFQIIAEEAIPLLRQALRSQPEELALQPRELLQWTFQHLHPTTAASIVNGSLKHKEHTNRLFWRVDHNTLLGRFYLLHPIAIRPETTEFIVGSSFDYSFIPEMCPSGRVDVITDSDEYLAIEMQPRRHEEQQIQWGPVQAEMLASSLADWTTANHRDNIKHHFVYHTSDIPLNLAEAQKELDAFVEKVARDLPRPQPYRNHHYWIGAMVAHRAQKGEALTAADWKFLLGNDKMTSGRVDFVVRCRGALSGSPTDVRFWSRNWLDYRTIQKKLRNTLTGDAKLIIVADQPLVFGGWFYRHRAQVSVLEVTQFLNLSSHHCAPLAGKFSFSLVLLSETDLPQAVPLLQRVAPLLRPGGWVLLSTIYDPGGDPKKFTEKVATRLETLGSGPLMLKEILCIPISNTRWRLHRVIRRLTGYVYRVPVYLIPVLAAATAGATAFMAILNLLSLRTRATPETGAYSSVLLSFTSPLNAVVELESNPAKGRNGTDAVDNGFRQDPDEGA